MKVQHRRKILPTLHRYQQEVVDKALATSENGIVVLETGMGKTRIAIENAASIASMLLTTEVVITDEPIDESSAMDGGMPGGMPGMM